LKDVIKNCCTKIILEKFSHETYYRSIKIVFSCNQILLFRYSYKYDTEEYIQKFKEFIVLELKTNKFELNRTTSIYYLTIENEIVNYIDKYNFVQSENKYLKDTYFYSYRSNTNNW